MRTKRIILVVYLTVSFALGLWAFLYRYDWRFSDSGHRFSARGMERRVCRSNLELLGMAMAMYVSENGLEKLPNSLEPIAEYLPDPGLLRCPYSAVETKEGWKGLDAHYEYCGAGVSLNAPFETPVVKERRLNHFKSYEMSFYGEPSTGTTIFEINVLRLDGTVEWQDDKYEVTEKDVEYLNEVTALRKKVLPRIDKICFVSFYVVLFAVVTLCMFIVVSPKRKWEARPAVKGAVCGASVAAATSLLLFGYSFFFPELVRLSVQSLVMDRFYYMVGLPAVLLGGVMNIPSMPAWNGVLVAYCLGIWAHHVLVGTALAVTFLVLGKWTAGAPRRERLRRQEKR